MCHINVPYASHKAALDTYQKVTISTKKSQEHSTELYILYLARLEDAWTVEKYLQNHSLYRHETIVGIFMKPSRPAQYVGQLSKHYLLPLNGPNVSTAGQ